MQASKHSANPDIGIAFPAYKYLSTGPVLTQTGWATDLFTLSTVRAGIRVALRLPEIYRPGEALVSMLDGKPAVTLSNEFSSIDAIVAWPLAQGTRSAAKS